MIVDTVQGSDYVGIHHSIRYGTLVLRQNGTLEVPFCINAGVSGSTYPPAEVCTAPSLASISATTDVIAASGGYQFVVALKSNGSVVCWTWGADYGQCNIPAAARQGGIVSVTTGRHFGMALAADGTLHTCECLDFQVQRS